MNQHTAWSINLGRWAGVRVRLHAFFLGFAVFTLYLGFIQHDTDRGLFWLSVCSTAVLLVSVILHEVGHVVATRQLGGQADLVVLGPWGGLAPVEPPWNPHEQLVVWLAGPVVNLLVCLLLAPLVALACDANPLYLLHPLNPVPLTEGAAWQIGIKLGFWINWLLVLVNLIPAFPFDGGRAFVAAAMSFSSRMTHERATATVVGIAKIGALLLVLAAVVVCFSSSAPQTSIVPTWLALALLAFCLYFSANQQEVAQPQDDEEEEKELFGYDFSQGYASFENSASLQQQQPPQQGALARWLQQRKQRRQLRQQEREMEEDARLDAILARLHESGMEGLTPEERALLKRASARYRSRLRS